METTIRVAYEDGSGIAINAYALLYNDEGEVYQVTTTSFVTFVGANIATYAITLPNIADDLYEADFPTAITAVGTYSVLAYKRAGGSPATTDTLIAEGEIAWNGSAFGEITSDEDLISLDYSKTYEGVTSTTDDAKRAVMITAASKLVKQYCNMDIVAKSYAEKYDGVNYRFGVSDYYGGSEYAWSFQLPHTPIISLSQVTFYPNDSSNTEVIAASQFVVNTATGELRLKPNATSSTLFPVGFQAFKVEYVAGYSVIPADIQLATAMVVQGLMSMSKRNLAMQSESINVQGYSYQVRQGGATNAMLTPEVQALLSNYRRLVTA
jgi:hypothetical protein